MESKFVRYVGVKRCSIAECLKVGDDYDEQMSSNESFRVQTSCNCIIVRSGMGAYAGAARRRVHLLLLLLLYSCFCC